MKKVVIIVFCVILMFNLTGCWSSHELNDYAFVIGVSMDKDANAKEVLLTAQIAKPSEFKSAGDSSGGSTEQAYWNIESEGESVFDLVREYTHESERKLYWNHNKVLLFGRTVAEEGIQDYLDFFMRGYEIRLLSPVFIAKEKASDILYVSPKLGDLPASSIDKLTQVQQFTSETSVVTLQEFACSLMCETKAPVAPFIEIIGEGEEQQIVISGTAIFKDDKLVGELNKNETRGYLWVVGKVQSGILVIDCPDGDGLVSVEIRNASSTITPEIKDGELKITVEIKEEGNIGDQSCKENLATTEKFEELEKEVVSTIKDEVFASLKIAQELNTDIYDFGGAVHRKYPGEWEELEEKWDEIFPNIEVEVIVEAKMNLTGKIFQPVIEGE